MSDVVFYTNKKSQNLYAEMLFKSLGARVGNQGSFAEGFRVVKAFLEEKGIDTTDFNMADGSGLSRLNHIKPAQMIGLLGAMYRGPEYDAFEDSFPIPGQDGAMRKRMKTLKTRGNIRAKTGFINGVTTLSGYIVSQDAETFAFTILVNNPQGTASVKEVMDKACALVSKFSRDPNKKPEPTPVETPEKTPKPTATPAKKK